MSNTSGRTAPESEAALAYDRLASIYDQAVPDPEGFERYYELATGASTNSILYVGCGTGRLLETLARKGHRCVGVDPSRSSLAYARDRIEDHADCALVNDGLPGLELVSGIYDRIVVAGGAFEYLMTTADQLQSLRRLTALIAPGGVILMDVAAPPFTTTSPRRNYTGLLPTRGGRDDAGLVVNSSSVTLGYDHFFQVVRSHCEFDVEGSPDPVVVEYKTRYTTLAEWRMLIALSGLKAAIYGGFRKDPISRSSANYVFEISLP